MKKILIVNKSFELGGIQSALKNMIDMLSKEDVQIDLMIFNGNNKEKNNFPQNVKLLEPCLPVKTMGMTLTDAVNSKNPLILILKVLFTIWSKIFGNRLPISFALMFQKKLTGYDYAVAYHHETGLKTTVSGFVRFILKKCDAEVKLGWIHSDFKATGLNTKQNRKLYNELDRIICVSKATLNSFLECFPELSEKSSYCYNCIPTDRIKKKSDEPVDFDMKKEPGETIFFSACRLSEEKGIERTIDAFIALAKEGFSFKWYIAGTGILFESITKKIQDNHIKNKIILMGYHQNPYPYMKKSDWLLLPSFHETFSMVAAESIILGTPVFATEMPVTKELIDDFNGYVCENSAKGIQNGLRHILTNKTNKYLNIKLKKDVEKTTERLKGIFEL